MIVTLTMNPSVDRTATLPGPLTVGGVNRIASVDDAPGGKGVNVTRVLAAGLLRTGLLGGGGVLAGVAALGRAPAAAGGQGQARAHAGADDGHPQCRLLHGRSSGWGADRSALVLVGTTHYCARG